MEGNRHKLSFNDAVRVGARVPLLGSLLILAALALATTTQWVFVDAALRGAPVATAQDALVGRRGPVEVVIDVVVPKTPLTQKNALTVVSTSQQLVGISGSLTVDELQPGRGAWGMLRPIRGSERSTLRMENEAAGSANLAPPMVLDTNVPTREQLLAVVAAALMVALGAIAVAIRAIGIVQQPLRSSVGRALARFGDPVALRASFDAALADDYPIVGRLHAPTDFLAFRSRAGFSVLPRADVMWVRQRRGPDPAFLSVIAFPFVLLRGLSSRAVYVHDRSGFRLRVPMSSRNERAVVTRELEALCPHSIFVDDKATRKYWRSHRRHFIDAVDQRRSTIEHFGVNDFVAPPTPTIRLDAAVGVGTNSESSAAAAATVSSSVISDVPPAPPAPPDVEQSEQETQPLVLTIDVAPAMRVSPASAGEPESVGLLA